MLEGAQTWFLEAVVPTEARCERIQYEEELVGWEPGEFELNEAHSAVEPYEPREREMEQSGDVVLGKSWKKGGQKRG